MRVKDYDDFGPEERLRVACRRHGSDRRSVRIERSEPARGIVAA